MNKVILVGRVGAEPKSNKTVTTFSLATSEYYTVDGERKEQTEWHRCVTFGRLAETVQQWVAKGQLLAIEGRIRTSSYEKDGETRYSTDILVSKLEMLSKGKERAAAPVPAPAPAPTNPHPYEPEDEDMPAWLR